MNKKIIIFATPRYAINFNDFYLFYSRSKHTIIKILLHENIKNYTWWKRQKYCLPYCCGPARENTYESPLNSNIKIIFWSTITEAIKEIEEQEFDYICMGNGNGDYQQEIIAKFGTNKCLFSEYGWLLWSSNFYISRNGCADKSDIALANQDDI